MKIKKQFSESQVSVSLQRLADGRGRAVRSLAGSRRGVAGTLCGGRSRCGASEMSEQGMTKGSGEKRRSRV